jgi:hypothetical protein
VARRRRPAIFLALVALVGLGATACVVPPPPRLKLPPPPSTQSSITTTLTITKKFQAPYASFTVAATHESFSTAAVGDVTGDHEPDIVAGGMDGHLRVWRLDGTMVIDHPFGGAMQASPLLADLTGDGVDDVVGASTAGTIAAIQPSNPIGGGLANLLFIAHDVPRPDGLRGFFSTPAIGDLDKNGSPEIVASSWDHNLWAWHLNGAVVAGFPVFLQDTSWSSPAVVDLDGDGGLEIVVGGDMDAFPGAPYPAGGLLWVFRANGWLVPASRSRCRARRCGRRRRSPTSTGTGARTS